MLIPGLTQKQLNLIQSFFPENCKVKLFGSRVNGPFRELSDLDICIFSQLTRSEVEQIIERFEESDLPFTVDIVLYSDCSPEFKKIIDATGVLVLF